MINIFMQILFLLILAFTNNKVKGISVDSLLFNRDKREEEIGLSQWTTENIGNGICQIKTEGVDTFKKLNNVLEILMNRYDEYLIEKQPYAKEEVLEITRNFLQGIEPNGENGPDCFDANIPAYPAQWLFFHLIASYLILIRNTKI